MTDDEYEVWHKDWQEGRGFLFSDGTIPLTAYFALGIAGETGELVEVVKKSFRATRSTVAGYGAWSSGFDREKMVLEMGDLEWYLTALRQTAGITRSEVLAANVAKLEARAAGGSK